MGQVNATESSEMESSSTKANITRRTGGGYDFSSDRNESSSRTESSSDLYGDMRTRSSSGYSSGPNPDTRPQRRQ